MSLTSRSLTTSAQRCWTPPDKRSPRPPARRTGPLRLSVHGPGLMESRSLSVITAPALELAGVARSVDEFDTLRLGATAIVLLDLQLPGSLHGPAAVAHVVTHG